MKIMIIDDSYEIRDVLRLLIERHNHEVVEAVDGQDGLEKAKTHRPDLIIIDALMPRVDGFTLLRNIKKDPRLHSIPCVLFSAIYTGGKDRTRLYQEGDFVLEKMRSRVVWRDCIQKALAEDRLVPWFQPILYLKDNNIRHYEALARMCDVDGSLFSQL